MNVVMTRDCVKASKIEGESSDEKNQTEQRNVSTEKEEIALNVQNNNENMKIQNGPKNHEHVIKNEEIETQIEELLENNRSLKKQLESRDIIIKRQISEIHRLRGENKTITKEQDGYKTEIENVKKEYQSEKWLADRLKNDVRDLQMQLDFQDCYLQEQSHQSGLMNNLVNELQKRNEAQQKEITQLKTQLQTAKQTIDNQIADLQNMLGIKDRGIRSGDGN